MSRAAEVRHEARRADGNIARWWTNEATRYRGTPGWSYNIQAAAYYLWFHGEYL